MNILHMQISGNPGGIVVLCRDIANNSKENHFMYFIFSGGIIADEMKKENINVTVANADRFRWKKSKKELIKFCEDNDIDVIINHAGSPITISHVLAVKKARPKTKIVMYLHSSAENGLGKKRKRITNWPYLYVFRKKADVIIAISKFVRASYQKAWGKNCKIEVAYNGVDPNKFGEHEDYYATGSMELLYVGRLFDGKGIGVLIEAIGKMDKTIPVHASIVGDGPGRAKYEQLTKELNLEDKITFYGSRADVPAFLSKADFFVHPAVLNEGFGITLAEALTAGVPCVAFHRGAIPEIIQDGYNGFVIDEVTSQALSDRLTECYNIYHGKTKYYELVDNAKESAHKFEIRKLVETIEGMLYGL